MAVIETAAPAGTGNGGNKHRRSSEAIRAAQAEVKARYDWQARQSRKDKAPMPLPNIRVSELEKLYASRWGAMLPDDDAGEEDLEIALHHLASMNGDTLERMICWTRKWAPWKPTRQAQNLCATISAMPRTFTSEELGERMRLCLFEREKLGIKTIAPFNMLSKEVRKRYQRFVERDRRREKRRAQGRQARKEYEANSLSKRKPWEAEGISRRTWERRRATAVASVSE